METTKSHTFLADWGLSLVMLAITLPVLGLAYLAWTYVPAPPAAPPAAVPTAQAKLLAKDVVTAFRMAGLPAHIVRAATKEEQDGLSSWMQVDALRFRISEQEGQMGMVFVFENATDLQRMRQYYLELNRSLPRFKSWLFFKDNILLQINHEVPESTARQYADALYGGDAGY